MASFRLCTPRLDTYVLAGQCGTPAQCLLLFRSVGSGEKVVIVAERSNRRDTISIVTRVFFSYPMGLAARRVEAFGNWADNETALLSLSLSPPRARARGRLSTTVSEINQRRT